MKNKVNPFCDRLIINRDQCSNEKNKIVLYAI